MLISDFIKQSIQELDSKGNIEKEFVSVFNNIYNLALDSDKEINTAFEKMCYHQYSKEYLDYYFHMWEHCCIILGV